MRYTHFLWDWNGTLVDDLDCAREAVNDMLRDRGRSPITTEQYHTYIDTPIRKFYERVFDLETEDYEVIIADYNRYYRKRMLEYGALRHGVVDLLNAAQRADIRQWTVTASLGEDVVAYLERFGILPYFECVLGSENRLAESKVGRVIHALQERQVDPSSVLVIGDTLHDLEMAKSCGSDCVLLLDGHQAESVLKAAHNRVFSSMKELQRELQLI